MPVSEQVQIALNMHSFNGYICDCIGNVHECCNLHFGSLVNSFKPFQSSFLLELVLDIDAILVLSKKNTKRTPLFFFVKKLSSEKIQRTGLDESTFFQL